MLKLPDNIRTRAIKWAGDKLNQRAIKPVRCLEIGAMFRLSEGASTIHLAEIAKAAGAGSKVVSIEADGSHITNAKKLLQEHDPELLPLVEFHEGMSLDVLPKIIEDHDGFDLLWLDGSAHPETCFRELELLLPKMSEKAIALVDDCHDMAETEAYPYDRTLGKASLILPMMMFSRYQKVRAEVIERAKDAQSWRSASVDAIYEKEPFPLSLQDLTIHLLQQGSGGVLAISKTSFEKPYISAYATPSLRRNVANFVKRMMPG